MDKLKEFGLGVITEIQQVEDVKIDHDWLLSI